MGISANIEKQHIQAHSPKVLFQKPESLPVSCRLLQRDNAEQPPSRTVSVCHCRLLDAACLAAEADSLESDLSRPSPRSTKEKLFQSNTISCPQNWMQVDHRMAVLLPTSNNGNHGQVVNITLTAFVMGQSHKPPNSSLSGPRISYRGESLARACALFPNVH